MYIYTVVSDLVKKKKLIFLSKDFVDFLLRSQVISRISKKIGCVVYQFSKLWISFPDFCLVKYHCCRLP